MWLVQDTESSHIGKWNEIESSYLSLSYINIKEKNLNKTIGTINNYHLFSVPQEWFNMWFLVISIFKIKTVTCKNLDNKMISHLKSQMNV